MRALPAAATPSRSPQHAKGRSPGTRRALGLAAAGALALGGCASMSEEDCLAGNWYVQGYDDANGGRTFDRFDEHVKACAKVDATPDEAVYGTGYEAGLVDYCTPERGYRLGSRDGDYRDICPFDTEAAFLGRYVDGLESALVLRESAAVNAELDLERAVLARASVPKGLPTKKADGELASARAELDRLRGERLSIREKIRRWNAELSAL